LFARKTKGSFILRIEDTDRNRLIDGAIQNLIETLDRLGLTPDESPSLGGKFGPYIQSQRLDLYHEQIRILLEKGFAYPCFCSPQELDEMRARQQANKEFVKYDRRCLHLSPQEVQDRLDANQPHVIRLKMPEDRKFKFQDLIRGEVEMDAAQSDDQVLLKADGFPTYHLAAVVDDHFMEITHVIRGEEWLSSTPKHIFLYECFGWEAPQWVHLPLILNPDRSKLSKRMNDVSVESYLQKGYLPEALINFIALLGWHAADDREMYSLEELCEEFSLERVSKSGAVFDLTKLDWMNSHYLKNLPLETIAQRSEPYFQKAGLTLPDPHIHLIALEAARQRCILLPELVDYCAMFYKPATVSEEDAPLLYCEAGQKVITWFYEHLPGITLSDPDAIKQMTAEGIQSTGQKGKNFYTPLRLALLSRQHGPDLPTTLSILGLDETRNRLQKAMKNQTDLS
ncbi:MAG: glutamate--tRNA ligase, partial [Candidatus Cloacimonetes bacterium]|nr:glutamate--tRNA ligase [Candidatus Cloacimonadota bacterium]